MQDRRPWGIVPSLLLFVPLFALTATYSAIKHYALPIPIGPVARDDLRPSESHILAVAQHLSETIGYRTVGTKEHADGDAWMHQQALLLQHDCARIAKSSGRPLECEVWHQEGSGHHRFDIMGHRLYKAYVGLTNIIVRVSNGTAAGKEHAILINSHIDSTPPSPGAADDALAVGVMLECIRVLIHDTDWDPTHAIIFLFNNAEESLQDGSHLYSTQHSTASTVRAVINLEAAGTKGPELLFQATSDEMIRAYASVPRPYGTVLANDVFSSGIILSDTDFRQFEVYLGVSGLDMAIVGHSYFYHTQKDTVEHIDPGVAQHMADNTLALLRYFTVPSSPLPSLPLSPPSSAPAPSHSHTSPADPPSPTDPSTPKPKPRTVYLSLLGTYFVTLSFPLASALYTSFLGACLALFWDTRAGGGIGAGAVCGMLHATLSLVSAIACSNAVALAMRLVLGRGMSWFAREWLPLVLYGPPAVLGALIPSILPLPSVLPGLSEYNTLAGTLLGQAMLATVLQTTFEVGSAVFLFMIAAPLFCALVAEGGGGGGHDAVKVGGDGKEGEGKGAESLVRRDGGHGGGGVRLRTYVIGGLVPVMVGTEVWCGVADVFVPLTGRMGEKAPAEYIIATLTAIIVSYTLPLLPAFSLRFLTPLSPDSHTTAAPNSHTHTPNSHTTNPAPAPAPRPSAALRSTASLLAALTALIMGLMALRTPYDALHPRRMYVVHCENITTGSTHLHFAGADSAPGLRPLVEGLAREFGGHGQGRGGEYDVGVVEMDDWNGDWDTLYPFSAFLTPYTIRLPHVEHSSQYRDTFRVVAENDVVDLERGTRSLTLKVVHPGVIWTVIAFDAHVLQWSLDAHPPPYFARHHVKEASFYGIDTWSLDLVMRLPSNSSSPSTSTQNASTAPFPLKVNFVGTKETVQFPAKRGKDGGGAELRLLGEMHEWLNETTGGAVDALLFGTVGGVVEL